PYSRASRASRGARPATRMRPSVGSMRSAMRRISVVLPQPEGPMRLTNCPPWMVRSASCSATASALPTTKRLLTPATSIIAGLSLIGSTSHRFARALVGAGRLAAQQAAAPGVADELAVPHGHLAAHRDDAGAPVDLDALEARVVDVHGLRLGADGAAVVGVVDHDVGVGAHRDHALPRVEAEQLRGARAGGAHEALEAQASAAHPVGVEQVHAVLDGGDAVGDLGEVAAPHLLLALEVEGRVVGDRKSGV